MMELDNTSDENFEILNTAIDNLLVKGRGLVQFTPEKRRLIKLETARKLSKTLKHAIAEIDDIVLQQTIMKFW
jgi:hypothetical protein